MSRPQLIAWPREQLYTNIEYDRSFILFLGKEISDDKNIEKGGRNQK